MRYCVLSAMSVPAEELMRGCSVSGACCDYSPVHDVEVIEGGEEGRIT